MPLSSPSPPLLPLPSADILALAPTTRATQACQGCRKRKARCINFVDGACQLCREKGTACMMAPNMAKDRAAQSRARNEENELLRQQMGHEGVQSVLQGSGADSEAALMRLGRVEGRVGGSGPAGSLEDLKRVCHGTENSVEFLPDATDAVFLAHLSADAPAEGSPAAHDEFGFNDGGQWLWSSGTVPHIEAFDQASYGAQWLPPKLDCEAHIEYYFEHLHPLMPMLSEAHFRACFAELWDESGQRGWKSWFPWTREPSPDLDETDPHRPDLSTEIAQFVPVLFAVLACAASAVSGPDGEGGRYHSLAIWNMHFMTTHSRPRVAGPQLHQMQVMALLSNHLASLGFMAGAWTAFKYGAELLRERGLHLNANHGHGVDAEIRRRTFWCLFNLDRMLGRILGKPFQIVMPLVGGCALPLALDEGTEQWSSYFDDGELLPATIPPASARISGFILLCKLSDLGSRVIKDLYPPARDRSQDWRFTGVRSMLESAIKGWADELVEVEEEIWHAFDEPGNDGEQGGQEVDRTEGLEEVVRNLALDVQLLIYRVQLPRSSQRAHRTVNSFALEPQLAVAREVLAVPFSTRAEVPRSIFSVQEVTTVFLALFPLLYQRVWDADHDAAYLEPIDRDVRRGIACLQALASSTPSAEIFVEVATDLSRLVASLAAKLPTSASGAGLKKKGKKPPKLDNLSKGKAVAKAEPNSAGFPQASSAMVGMSLNSPRIVSPRSAPRFQPYPQSPPDLPAHISKATHGGRPRPSTFGGGGGARSRNDYYPSRSGPRTIARYSLATSQPYSYHHHAGGDALLPNDGPLSDTSFSLSPREPRTPLGHDSAAEWSSPEASSDRGREGAPAPAADRRRYSAPLSLVGSPHLPAQPLGFDEEYEMEEDQLSVEGGGGTAAHFPSATTTTTYAIPTLQPRASSSGLFDVFGPASMKPSPTTPASFPGYDRFASPRVTDRSRQPSGYAPWDLSHPDGMSYRPLAPPSAFRPPPPLSSSFASANYAPPYHGNSGLDHTGYGFSATEAEAFSAGDVPSAGLASTSAYAGGTGHQMQQASSSAGTLGQHAHPFMFQHHHHQNRRR